VSDFVFGYEVGDPITKKGPGPRIILERGSSDSDQWMVALADEGVITWRGRLADLARSFKS
jgi:hypothetical protein